MNTAGATAPGDLLTAEDLAELPDEGSRFDLIQGVLQKMPPAGFDHGLISATIASHLDRFVRDHGLGWVVGAETGFVLARNPDTVLAPDAAFVSADRMPPPGERQGFAALAPIWSSRSSRPVTGLLPSPTRHLMDRVRHSTGLGHLPGTPPRGRARSRRYRAPSTG